MSNSYRDKLLSIGVMKGGRSRDIVKEGRDSNGDRIKAVTDQAGNTVTEHDNAKDQVDVLIRAPHILNGKEMPHSG